LVFFGHEARPMSFVYKDGRVLSGYDLLHAFVKQNDLPEGAVWFVHGSLDGEHEFQEWKKARGIPHVAPFEVRSLEPYSYMAKQTRLTHQDGFNLSVNWDIDPDHGGHTYKSIQLELVPLDRPLAEIYANIPNENAPPPSKLFLCMNRVVRPHRRLIVCFLQRIGLLDKSLVSFREENPSQTRFDDPGLQTAWEDVQKKLPLTIDRDLPLDNVAYARGNFAAVSIGEAYPYRQAYFNIVNETHFFSSVRFVSEKIWKPILNGQPFMVVGTPGSLAYVQSLGFKTFAPRIDESYDAIVDDDHRMKSLFLLIGRLGQMSLRQWADLHQELKPIADFNAELLQSIRTPMELVFDEIAAHLSQKTNGSSY